MITRLTERNEVPTNSKSGMKLKDTKSSDIQAIDSEIEADI